MPSFGLTPEALLGRNDSKNPSSTCKGLTSSGRSCRRALAATSATSSPIGRRKSGALGGVVAIVQEDGEVAEAEFYCWQHKAQAEERVVAEEEEEGKRKGGKRQKRRSTELFPLKEKSSIDTMVQRLGLEAVAEEGAGGEGKRKKSRNPRPPRRTETVDFAHANGSMVQPSQYGFASEQPVRRKTKERKAGFWASLCCMTGALDDEDYVEIVRHKKRTESERPQETATAASAPPRIPSNKPSESRRQSNTSLPARKPVGDLPTRPAAQHRSSSNTHTISLLSLIPQHLIPQTISALLAELIKPISPHDEEGYIYIFWLTPQTRQAPAEETARSLLSPTSAGARPQHGRRVSDVMTEFTFDGTEPETQGKKTIMLKIGRANNVTRRMNEWQRQCGYALNLVRWYPHIASSTSAAPSPQPSPSATRPLYPDLSKPALQRPAVAVAAGARRQSEIVRKVPCVKRVERLIHLELQDQQVKRQCTACGKEHREWFEVQASQEGIRRVDECVKRWVGWAERESL